MRRGTTGGDPPIPPTKFVRTAVGKLDTYKMSKINRRTVRYETAHYSYEYCTRAHELRTAGTLGALDSIERRGPPDDREMSLPRPATHQQSSAGVCLPIFRTRPKGSKVKALRLILSDLELGWTSFEVFLTPRLKSS